MDNIKDILDNSNRVQSNKSRSDRKAKGVFYTPFEVVGYMMEKLLQDFDLFENPYVRILDPACGTGLFLIKAFEILKRKFEQDYDRIAGGNKLKSPLNMDDISIFVVENNLWGADIDSEALGTARDSLIKLAGRECRTNLLHCDSLIEGGQIQISLFDEASGPDQDFFGRSFDYIVGNPPYIGHKGVSNKYKKLLQQLYPGIYADKSDISYCFIKKGIDLLSDGGSLSFITSRYFMEGPSASGLRKYIRDNCTVSEIVDFYGRQVFEDAGVAACVITLQKGQRHSDTRVARYSGASSGTGTGMLLSKENFEHFTIKQSGLKDEGWVLVNPERYEIFSLLESKGTHALGEIFESYQGIITGCDMAFILDKDGAREFNIEKNLLKPWIKNSNIGKFSIKPADKYLIYSDFIEDERDFPNAVKFIGQYRERLMKRRECQKGVRKWYELQWGRKSEVFEAPKIIYPFKSSSNRFAVDETGYYCSADVYSLQLKEKYRGLLTLDYVAAILNSRLFEFYFKCYAKKISSDLYDYYPNTVLRLKLMVKEMDPAVLELADKLKNCKKEEDKNDIIDLIDREVYKLYGLNEKQIDIVAECHPERN